MKWAVWAWVSPTLDEVDCSYVCFSVDLPVVRDKAESVCHGLVLWVRFGCMWSSQVSIWLIEICWYWQWNWEQTAWGCNVTWEIDKNPVGPDSQEKDGWPSQGRLAISPPRKLVLSLKKCQWKNPKKRLIPATKKGLPVSPRQKLVLSHWKREATNSATTRHLLTAQTRS